MEDDAGLSDLAGRIDDAADDTVGANSLPDAATGVDRFQAALLPLARQAVEVPPWDAVLGCDDSGLSPKQRLDGIQGGRDGVGLEREDDVVLGAGLFAGLHRSG